MPKQNISMPETALTSVYTVPEFRHMPHGRRLNNWFREGEFCSRERVNYLFEEPMIVLCRLYELEQHVFIFLLCVFIKLFIYDILCARLSDERKLMEIKFLLRAL